MNKTNGYRLNQQNFIRITSKNKHGEDALDIRECINTPDIRVNLTAGRVETPIDWARKGYTINLKQIENGVAITLDYEGGFTIAPANRDNTCGVVNLKPLLKQGITMLQFIAITAKECSTEKGNPPLGGVAIPLIIEGKPQTERIKVYFY